MKQSRLKQFIQCVAVRTQFFPFVHIYQALYASAIRLCTRRLRKISGVRSIYLRRGLAGGRPLYGLSDIDLMVMIDTHQNSRVSARVRYQYELLRLFIPMLATGELELYGPEQFKLLHEYSLFYRHRFEQGRSEWRRLWGEDLFEDLPPASGEMHLLALQELSPSWYYLAQELVKGDERPAYLRRYVAYKAIAEVARAALVAQGENAGISRDAALSKASEEYLEGSQALRAIRSMREDLISPEPIPVDTLIESYLFLTRKAQAAIQDGTAPHNPSAHAKTDEMAAPLSNPQRATRNPQHFEPDPRRKLRIQPLSPEGFHPFCFDEAVKEIECACAVIEEVERAILIPRLNFDPLAEPGMDLGELVGATVDALDLVFIGRHVPAVDKLRALNSVLDRFHPWVNGFFCDLATAVSLRPIQGSTVRLPQWTPEFFACLGSTRPLGNVLELAVATDVHWPHRRFDFLDQRAGTLFALFQQPDIFRIPTRSFFTLFWELGRVVWLTFQARQQDIIKVPVSSDEIVEALVGLTPSFGSTLRTILREYRHHAAGLPSEAVRYINWARWYALKLDQLLSSSGPITMEHTPPARTELTISVAIVTRNRAQFVRAALQSIENQQRPPDQVVVVDNGSTDETSATVNTFAGRMNLLLVREDRIGIPFARNRALKHCTGDIVALLDDDCVADSGWLKELERPFLKDPRIGAVGGSVLPFEGQPELVARFYGSRMRSVVKD